ncbi:MAG: ATP-binding protein [Acidobacteria bacterium]|nr:ATP-binding protein [Acidobacteriota bacterium]
MQAVATTLTAVRERLRPGKRAGAIPYIGRDNEPACRICSDTGWCRAEGEEFIGLKRCKCVKERIRAARLVEIPERFRESTFESYRPGNPKQEWALCQMLEDPDGSYYLTGSYGSGKTHLLYAQYRQMVLAGKIRCHVRTTRGLVEELRRAEFDDGFVSPVLAAASKPDPYRLFWDDLDKLKPADFKTEVLFDLVNSLYDHIHGLTVTANYSLRELIEHERMHPAIVRRLDDMCGVIAL